MNYFSEHLPDIRLGPGVHPKLCWTTMIITMKQNTQVERDTSCSALQLKKGFAWVERAIFHRLFDWNPVLMLTRPAPVPTEYLYTFQNMYPVKHLHTILLNLSPEHYFIHQSLANDFLLRGPSPHHSPKMRMHASIFRPYRVLFLHVDRSSLGHFGITGFVGLTRHIGCCGSGGGGSGGGTAKS